MMYALILGGGSCVWQDLAGWERLYGVHDGPVVAANDVGVHWVRRLDHWVSLHPEKFYGSDPRHPEGWGWVRQRKERGHSMDFTTWAKRGPDMVNRLVRDDPWTGGSSGLLAIQVGLMHADRAVLCGIPMTPTQHFRESLDHQQHAKWRSANAHWRGWKRRIDSMMGVVRSMSGRTREVLGAPDEDWLNGG